MARLQQPHDHTVHRLQRCKQMSWTKTGICVPLILALLGRIMKHSCTVSGWLGRNFLGQRDTNRSCPHHIQKKRRSRPFTHDWLTLEFGPETITIARPAVDHLHCPATEARQGYRPAAPIQRFNNKSLNWPAWFRHFRAVTDVHGWPKEQRALQLVSYLDETAMNVAQELGDSDLYNYDVLVKLLGDRFDPASRVSASRSRFHAKSRRHHEDADAFADALAELCRVGYPQSPPEL